MLYIIIAIVAAFIGGIAAGLIIALLTMKREPKVLDHSIYMETIAIDNDKIY